MLKNSDQDDVKPLRLDQSYIEYDIFSLIKIDLVNLIKIKAQLAKEFHIQPSEIDWMQVWEYELFIKLLNEIVKEANEEQEAEQGKYSANQYMKQAKSMIPKMPSMPSMPKF